MPDCEEHKTPLEETLIINADPKAPPVLVCWKCEYEKVMSLSDEQLRQLFPREG